MPRPTASPARTRRRWPRITAWTVGGILLILIVGGVVFAFQARSVWSDLTSAKSDLSSVLKDVKMREQAGLIQKEVGTLLKDVERLGDRVDSLKRHFGQANTDIDQIVTSAGKITSRGEKIRDVELQDGEPATVAPPAAPPLL